VNKRVSAGNEARKPRAVMLESQHGHPSRYPSIDSAPDKQEVIRRPHFLDRSAQDRNSLFAGHSPREDQQSRFRRQSEMLAQPRIAARRMKDILVHSERLHHDSLDPGLSQACGRHSTRCHDEVEATVQAPQVYLGGTPDKPSATIRKYHREVGVDEGDRRNSRALRGGERRP
jgi:hypothetical protein